MEPLEIFSGTFGFRITIDTGRDLTDAETIRLRIRKPDNSNVDKSLNTLNILEPKTDGKVFYDVVMGDFTIPGSYKLQLFDETGGSMRLASEIIKIKAKSSLDYVG